MMGPAAPGQGTINRMWGARQRGVLLLGVLLAGCSIEGDYSQTRFQCEEFERCPSGQVCVEGVCLSTVPGSDGGPDARPDAGSAVLLGWETTLSLPEPRGYN